MRGRGAAPGGAPPPRDDLAELLAHVGRAALRGRGLRSVPAGTARRLGLDALTVSAVGGGLPELVWCDPAEGLGPDLEELQFTLGDGPTPQAARRGHALTEPDLTVADPARWPAFLPAAAGTSARSVIALPLQFGVTTVGVLTGYRTTPGALTAGQRRDVHRMGRMLRLLLLDSAHAVPADGMGPRADLVLQRAEIHQAVGFLAAELRIPLAEALLRLRAHAAAHDQSLTGLAHAVLARRLPVTALDE